MNDTVPTQIKGLSVPPCIWIFTEHRNATYAINFDYPLRHLIQTGQIKLISWSGADLKQRSWAEISLDLRQRLDRSAERPVAVIVSRLVHPYGLELLELFGAAKIPNYFHIDDLLFELPADLGSHYTAVYDAAYRHALHDCMLKAGAVLASTSTLAAELQRRFPSQSIQTLAGVCYLPALVQRRHPLRFLRRMKQRWQKRGTIVIGYMGSNSHARDLAVIVPQLVSLLRSDPKLRFETLGLPMPQELLELGPERVRSFGYTNSYPEFLGRLYELDWDIGLAPLANDVFNRSKTVTKFVEYTSCEIPIIASAIMPYAELATATQALAVANGDEWMDVLKRWAANPSERNVTMLNAKKLCVAKFKADAVSERLLEQILV